MQILRRTSGLPWQRAAGRIQLAVTYHQCHTSTGRLDGERMVVRASEWVNVPWVGNWLSIAYLLGHARAVWGYGQHKKRKGWRHLTKLPSPGLYLGIGRPQEHWGQLWRGLLCQRRYPTFITMPYKFTGKYTDIQFAARLEISLHLTRPLTNFSVLSMDFEGNEKILNCLPKIWRCRGRNSEFWILN